MNKTTTALTLAIQRADNEINTPRPETESTDFNCGYDLAMEEIKKYLISLLQKEREDMEKMAADVWFDEGYTKIEATKRKATAMFDNNFTQYKTETNG